MSSDWTAKAPLMLQNITNSNYNDDDNKLVVSAFETQAAGTSNRRMAGLTCMSAGAPAGFAPGG